MPENGFLGRLKRLNSFESECQFPHLISRDASTHRSDRISRLQNNDNLEKAARAVLKHLGELKHLYLITASQL